MPTPYALSSDLVSAWPAKSLEVATYLDTALAAKYDSAPAINAQTGGTYTFVLADATAGKTITASNASASTYTVPPQSSVAFSAGALLRVTNLGAGILTFAGGVGVTVTNTAGTLAQYQSATLVRTGSDAWTVIPAGGASGLTLVATVTASAASSLSINSCFTSTYANYRYIFDGNGSGSAVPTYMRFRVSGVDSSAASYSQRGLFAAATTGAYSLSNVTSFELTHLDSGTSSTVSGDVIAPNLSSVSRVSSMGMGYNGNYQSIMVMGVFGTTTVFDGFTIYPQSGTMSGTLRVYGYRNA